MCTMVASVTANTTDSRSYSLSQMGLNFAAYIRFKVLESVNSFRGIGSGKRNAGMAGKSHTLSHEYEPCLDDLMSIRCMSPYRRRHNERENHAVASSECVMTNALSASTAAHRSIVIE